jgi:E3 ubiquitin ligase
VIPAALIFKVGISPPTGLLIWCGIGFFAGLGLFFYGFRLLQRRRLILDTPLSKIRSASMGMVEINGLAVGPYTMTAPITSRPCYYYRTVVWEYKSHGDNQQWVKVASECMYVPFFVDDNTGRLLVDPRGAELDLHCDFKDEFYGSFFSKGDSAPENISRFLLRYGVVTSNKLKIEESCIKPKNSLFILGTLEENPGLAVSPRPIPDVDTSGAISTGKFSISINSLSFHASPSSASTATGHFGAPVRTLATRSAAAESSATGLSRAAAASATSSSQQQKIAAALLKAGIANPTAWPSSGVPSAGVQVFTSPLSSTADNGGRTSNSDPTAPANVDGFEVHPPVVLMKGKNNTAFLISWRSQQDLARAMGWKCTLMIWGGPALALLSLYFFLAIRSLF